MDFHRKELAKTSSFLLFTCKSDVKNTKKLNIKVCNFQLLFVSIDKSLKLHKKIKEKSQKVLIFEIGNVIINM